MEMFTARRIRLVAGGLLASSAALMGVGLAGGATSATGTESDLEWTVPTGVEIVQLHLVGGGGGRGANAEATGGKGCEIHASIPVQAGGTLKLIAGHVGSDGTNGTGGAGGAGPVAGVLTGGVGGNSAAGSGAGGGGGASVGGFSPAGQSSSTAGGVAAGGGGGGGGMNAGNGGSGCANGGLSGGDGSSGGVGDGGTGGTVSGANSDVVTPGVGGTGGTGDGSNGVTTDNGGSGNGGAGGNATDGTDTSDSAGGGGGGGAAGGGGGSAGNYDETNGGGAGASIVQGAVTGAFLVTDSAADAMPMAEAHYVNVLTTSMAPIVAGQAYSAQLDAVFGSASDRTGGTMFWSVSPALPAGLTLNARTGLVSGTPTAGADGTNYTFTAQWRLTSNSAPQRNAAPQGILVAQSSLSSSLTTTTAVTLPTTGDSTGSMVVLGAGLGVLGLGLVAFRRRIAGE